MQRRRVIETELCRKLVQIPNFGNSSKNEGNFDKFHVFYLV